MTPSEKNIQLLKLTAQLLNGLHVPIFLSMLPFNSLSRRSTFAVSRPAVLAVQMPTFHTYSSIIVVVATLTAYEATQIVRLWWFFLVEILAG